MRITETFFGEEKQSIYFDADLAMLDELYDRGKIIILTDENILRLHAKKLEAFRTISIPAGESNKIQSTVDHVIERLLEMDADKSSLLVGVGGGVITDIAGYVSAIFKRGMKLALVPTTILGMTDAAIGGKNGVNAGAYKNMVGTTRQAIFILYDYSFLQTLPKEEWVSGFAEIIKHACIKDADMFDQLEDTSLEEYMADKDMAASLIEKNVAIKMAVVVNDEHETGERYLLNFGHTFGHAIENIYKIPHGFAVSLGMIIAGKFSKEINNFSDANLSRLINLLHQYHLPVDLNTDPDAVTALLKKDKKRAGNYMNFVLLQALGKAAVTQLTFEQIEDLQKRLV